MVKGLMLYCVEASRCCMEDGGPMGCTAGLLRSSFGRGELRARFVGEDFVDFTSGGDTTACASLFESVDAGIDIRR